MNAPNDVVVKSDGSVWFTDPGYGIMMDYEGHKAPFELPTQVYRLDPDTGEATVVADDLKRPNGLCFSPDESRLYIVDTGVFPQVIRVYDLADGVRLTRGRLFIELSPGSSDGVRCDSDGNLWAAAGHVKGEGADGVCVYAPEGRLIGIIHLPEICANLCFGGRKRNRLFMAASQSIYSVYVEAIGAQVP